MKRSRTLAAAMAALTLGACASTPHAHVDIGLARVGLTLAFSDKALKDAPVPPQVIIRLIPAPPSLTAEKVPNLAPFVVPPSFPTPAPAPAPSKVCPSAPAGTSVPEAAPLVIPAPPKAGYYRLYNTGTLKVTADGFTFQFPYPKVTVMQVTNVHPTAIDTAPGVPAAGTTPAVSFDEITTLSPTDSITETYVYDAAEMDLVSHTEKHSGAVGSDTWSPPVKVYASGGIGTSWNALGTDTPQRHAMAFQGAINSSKVVDACGSLIDTLQVTSTTTIADLRNGQTSGTTPGGSDVSDVATELGGLFAQRHLQDTTVETVNNAAVTVVTDVVSTLDGTTPSATPPIVVPTS